jgi:DNA-binding winged helix-turn-helix (wHTH) protein
MGAEPSGVPADSLPNSGFARAARRPPRVGRGSAAGRSYNRRVTRSAIPPTRVRFGALVLDRAGRQLRRGDTPRPLKPKAFELLDLLVDRRPAAVSKQEIRDRLWPDTFVSDSTLSSLAAQVRRALGRDEARAIRTVHGFGYAFAAEATEEAPSGRPRPVGAYLFWNRITIPLSEGENVVGRDPGVAVRIDAPGISRHHATILVAGGRFFLEDLASKNGTYLREKRLDRRAELQDGDELRLGQTPLVFRTAREGEPTATEPSRRG